VNSDAPEELAVPDPLVTHVMLLLNEKTFEIKIDQCRHRMSSFNKVAKRGKTHINYSRTIMIITIIRRYQI